MANITCYIKKKKTLCNTLNGGNWNLGFVELGARWAKRDKYKFLNILLLLTYAQELKMRKKKVLKH